MGIFFSKDVLNVESTLPKLHNNISHDILTDNKKLFDTKISDENKNFFDIESNFNESSDKSQVNKKLEQEIDTFIEDWFKNNNEVDLGNIEFMNQKIDLIPDSVEKLIYKKALMIGVTFVKKILTESKINILNQNITVKVED